MNSIKLRIIFERIMKYILHNNNLFTTHEKILLKTLNNFFSVHLKL
jgi:hypothetical protein